MHPSARRSAADDPELYSELGYQAERDMLDSQRIHSLTQQRLHHTQQHLMHREQAVAASEALAKTIDAAGRSIHGLTKHLVGGELPLALSSPPSPSSSASFASSLLRTPASQTTNQQHYYQQQQQQQPLPQSPLHHQPQQQQQQPHQQHTNFMPSASGPVVDHSIFAPSIARLADDLEGFKKEISDKFNSLFAKVESSLDSSSQFLDTTASPRSSRGLRASGSPGMRLQERLLNIEQQISKQGTKMSLVEELLRLQDQQKSSTENNATGLLRQVNTRISHLESVLMTNQEAVLALERASAAQTRDQDARLAALEHKIMQLLSVNFQAVEGKLQEQRVLTSVNGDTLSKLQLLAQEHTSQVSALALNQAKMIEDIHGCQQSIVDELAAHQQADQAAALGGQQFQQVSDSLLKVQDSYQELSKEVRELRAALTSATQHSQTAVQQSSSSTQQIQQLRHEYGKIVSAIKHLQKDTSTLSERQERTAGELSASGGVSAASLKPLQSQTAAVASLQERHGKAIDILDSEMREIKKRFTTMLRLWNDKMETLAESSFSSGSQQQQQQPLSSTASSTRHQMHSPRSDKEMSRSIPFSSSFSTSPRTHVPSPLPTPLPFPSSSHSLVSNRSPVSTTHVTTNKAAGVDDDTLVKNLLASATANRR